MPVPHRGDLVIFATKDNKAQEATVLATNDYLMTLGLKSGDKLQVDARKTKIIKPRFNIGSVVRTTQDIEVGSGNIGTLSENSVLYILDYRDSYALICPLELMEGDKPTRQVEVRKSYLWPVAGEFLPGRKVIVGDERKEGKIIAIDVEGIVIEYKDQVGVHSYDGMGKSGHCDIVDKSVLELKE